MLTNDEHKILMLGDSITERGLWNELCHTDDIINRGIGGDTVQGIIDRMDYIHDNHPQGFLMIGINDLLNGQSVHYVFNNYKKIIALLREKNIPMVIQSTLHVGADAPDVYNKRVQELNALLEKFALEQNLLFLDINKTLAPNGYLENKYSLDGLHLNGAAYVQWSKILSNCFNYTSTVKTK
ncbi:MAG: GDSL-type esterase/lipase family protein [Campylobacterota bacterium]|nr:GDSL-type esterase/lipase family protein [Campylobacterota bacterium]